MSTARTDIAIETAEAIAALIAAERSGDDDDAAGLTHAERVVKTFIAALRIQQPPRRGRPPGKTTQRRLLGTIPAGGAE